jgi:DNA-binding beta-propeller fold protein YncE
MRSSTVVEDRLRGSATLIRGSVRWLASLSAALTLLGGASAARAAPFVYVVNSNDATVSEFDAASGSLSALPGTPAAAGTNATFVAGTPDGHYLYVANQNDNTISEYAIGADGGLTALPQSPVTTGPNSDPFAIVVSPNGKNVYVADYTNVYHTAGRISQYSVGPNGGLTPLANPTVATGDLPGWIAVSPDSKNVYVTNTEGSDAMCAPTACSTVDQYSVGADGSLTSLSPATVATGPTPGGVVVSPNGNNVYVTDQFDDTVSQYIRHGDGTLTPMNAPTVPAGNLPYAIAITPNGKYVYAADNLGASISEYSVGSDGSLTQLSPTPVPAGSHVFDLKISPDGNSLYATNSNDNDISQYTINGDGTLTAKTTPTVMAGNKPTGLAIVPAQQSPPPPPPPPPIKVQAAFTLPSTAIPSGGLAEFNASSSTSSPTGAGVASYAWAINNKPAAVCGSSSPYMSTQFLSSAPQTVGLTVTSATGAVTSTQKTLTFTGPVRTGAAAVRTGATVVTGHASAVGLALNRINTNQVFACSSDPGAQIAGGGCKKMDIEVNIVKASGCFQSYEDSITINSIIIGKDNAGNPIVQSGISRQPLNGVPLCTQANGKETCSGEAETLFEDITDYYTKNVLPQICKNGPQQLKYEFCQQVPNATGQCPQSICGNGKSPPPPPARDQPDAKRPPGEGAPPVAHTTATPVVANGVIPNTVMNTPCSQVPALPTEPKTGYLQQSACLQLYVSTAPVTINGLTYTPQPGAVILVAPEFNLVISNSAAVSLSGVTLKTAQSINYMLPDLAQLADQDYTALDVPNVQTLIAQQPPAERAAAQQMLGSVGSFPSTGALHVGFTDYGTAITFQVALPSPFTNGSGGQVTVTVHGTVSNTQGFQVIDGYLGSVNGGGVSVDLGPVQISNFGVCFRAHSSSDPNLDPCPGITGIPEDPSFGDNFWDASGEVDIGDWQVLLGGNPPSGCPAVGRLGIGFSGTSLRFAGGGLVFGQTGSGVPIGPGITLDKLFASITANDQFDKFAGCVQVSVAGGFVSIDGQVFVVVTKNGSTYTLGPGDVPGIVPTGVPASYPFTNHLAVGASGTLSVNLPVIGSVDVASAYALYVDNPGAVFFGGGFDFSIPPGKTYEDPDPPVPGMTFKAGIYGAIGLSGGFPPPFYIEGVIASVGRIPDIPPLPNIVVYRASADGIVSYDPRTNPTSGGIALCGSISVFGIGGTGGFGYQWGDDILDFLKHGVHLGSCDFLQCFRINVQATSGVPPCPDSAPDTRAHVARAGTTLIPVPRGTPAVNLQLSGQGGAPDVTITGPGGVRASTSGLPPDQGTMIGHVMVVRVPQLDMTYVDILHSAAGTYRLTLNSGSAPISGLIQANAFTPSVSARVTGQGVRRLIRYSVKTEPGQRITFLDATAHGQVLRILGSTTKARGSLAFTAVRGSGRHQLRAEVLVDGRPQKTMTVAGYVAPKLERLRRVRAVHVTRAGSTAKITFTAVQGARSYDVYVALQDGQRTMYHTRSRGLTIGGIFAEVAGTVTVNATGDNVNTLSGPGARATLPSAVHFEKVVTKPHHHR